MQMTAIILAGGKASRMQGKSKAFLKLGQEPLIKRQLRLLKKTFKQIIIVTNTPQTYRNFKGVKVVPDIIPHQGPLGGIYSGLIASEDKFNFVLACDMPFVNPKLINYIFRRSPGYDAVVPYADNRYEPLFAVYSKNCIEPIKELINKKLLKLEGLFRAIKIKKITEKEVLRFGLPEMIFMNINTLLDLKQIKRRYVN
jgi:molybdopterin-guanine dinucleotide biosynthesis protein A